MTRRRAGRNGWAAMFAMAAVFTPSVHGSPPSTSHAPARAIGRGNRVADPSARSTRPAASTRRTGPSSRRTVTTSPLVAFERGARVPHRAQSGPTCGLYALGMVMDYYRQQDPTALNPWVRPQDAWHTGSYSIEPNSDDLILARARQFGFTTEGGMFSAHEMAQLARHYGYRTRVMAAVTAQDIEAALDRHHPVLIAYDADLDRGDPGRFGGEQPHWAVLEGHYLGPGGARSLVATHGFPSARDHLMWRMDRLLRSNAQMTHADALRPELRDLAQLRGFAIEVMPPVRRATTSRARRP